jgi:translation initiation factor 1
MTPISDGNSRPVYSTDGGRIREDRPSRSAPAPGPGDDVVRISRSESGRKGKTVTLVSGVPPGEQAALAKELKRLCGAGGAVREGVVEVQGDHRDVVLRALEGRYRVKLAGG